MTNDSCICLLVNNDVTWNIINEVYILLNQPSLEFWNSLTGKEDNFGLSVHAVRQNYCI